MGKKHGKTLQQMVSDSLRHLALLLSAEPFDISISVVSSPDKSAPLEQQVIRFNNPNIIVPGNMANDAFPNYSDKDHYAEIRREHRIGVLAGVPLFYLHNPLVKPLLANNRPNEYMFWSWLVTHYCGFVHNLNVSGEKDTYRYADRVLNNARTSDDFGSIALDYAAQMVKRSGPKALRQVVSASTTAEIHDMVKPREFLFHWYMQQQRKLS